MRNSVTLSIYYGADTTCLYFQNSVNTLITMQKKKKLDNLSLVLEAYIMHACKVGTRSSKHWFSQ